MAAGSSCYTIRQATARRQNDDARKLNTKFETTPEKTSTDIGPTRSRNLEQSMKEFFGRASITNTVISRLIFFAMNCRLAYLRTKNILKKRFRFLKPRQYTLQNSSESASSFGRLIRQGYDKINIGGGEKNLQGFVNIDFIAHPNVILEVQANILDLSFISDASVSHIHSNHVVEHLTKQELMNQLHMYRRILKESGLLTIRCPNALGVCYGFWFDTVPETQREEFLALGYPQDDDFFKSNEQQYHRNFFWFLHWLYGDAGNIENQHLQIITPSGISSAVKCAGFEILKMTAPETNNIVLVARKNDRAEHRP
jgi:predicted SAM-dependent methyltransferase